MKKRSIMPPLKPISSRFYRKVSSEQRMTFFSPKKTDWQSVLCGARRVYKCIAVCIDGLGAGLS